MRACRGRGAAALLALSALAACQPEPAPRHYVIAAFGTIVQVDIAGVPPATADAAMAELERLYQRLDRDWRSFGPGELGRVNDQLAAGQAARLTPELQHLVERALEIRERSGGLFDPRIGSLVALWGFADMAHETPDTAPDAATVETTRVTTLRNAQLRLTGDVVSASAPVRLELAGIAKGAALAAGADTLRRMGVADALIVAGGDVLAIGRHGQRAWRVGVRNPLQPGILGTVELGDGEAAVSSGNYERSFEADGQRYHHLIDPRTGRPARGAAGVTVVGRDAELANAAAAALLIGGPQQFSALARNLGVDCALLVAEDGTRDSTPCMRERLLPP